MNNRRPYIIPKEKAREILEEAMSLSKSCRADQLDCSISWVRQPTDKTPEEVLEIGLNCLSTVFNFIYRDQSFMQETPDYWDVGLSTIGSSPNYFLWIVLDVETGGKLVEKYELK